VNIASNLDDGYAKDSVILFDSATPYYYDDVRISAYSYGMNGVQSNTFRLKFKNCNGMNLAYDAPLFSTTINPARSIY